MRTLRRLLPVAALAAALTLAGCSDDSSEGPSSADSGAASGSVSVSESPSVGEIREAIDSGAIVIDVRTPDEFAAGHLRDAVNHDFYAPGFARKIGRLDPKKSYVLYCASGNRAGQAQQMMLDQGFTDVMNAGGYEDLAASGFATTK